ncbi:MAG: methylisocitrate lyase [Dehalococcoidia bacterium]|nr:methylisocitrate lyase [Dehalococcoidia bacterium]
MRQLISEDGALPVAGVYNPLSALIAEQVGFRALYFSGAAFSASLGIPDIGLFTLDELSTAVRWVTRATSLPLIVDADTGFGEALNVFRTVNDIEAAGAAAIQIEDQVMPKRCGHLEGKQIVSAEEFVAKIRAATEARNSSLIIARTDSKAVYGMDDAVRRGHLYLEAGADIVFPEALESEVEFAEYARRVDAPLLANMTEFGKTPYLTVQQFHALGYELVIFPVTSLRIAAHAMNRAMSETLTLGTQENLVGDMQTRAELYELIRYSEYERMDQLFTLQANTQF